MAEHQALKGEMDKEKREMEMAIARSVVDHQRLEIEKKSQEDLMEQQMKKLSLTASATPGTGNTRFKMNNFLNSPSPAQLF